MAQDDVSDGLPIVPPTEARVEAMLRGVPWRDAEEVISIVPPRMGAATVRLIAVNAVMAGAKPEYLLVIVAALQAVSEPEYGLSRRQTTTHARAPLITVNGPIIQRLCINCGRGVFLNYASSGTGGVLHLSAALFFSLAGIDAVHVPYKGERVRR